MVIGVDSLPETLQAVAVVVTSATPIILGFLAFYQHRTNQRLEAARVRNTHTAGQVDNIEKMATQNTGRIKKIAGEE